MTAYKKLIPNSLMADNINTYLHTDLVSNWLSDGIQLLTDSTGSWELWHFQMKGKKVTRTIYVISSVKCFVETTMNIFIKSTFTCADSCTLSLTEVNKKHKFKSVMSKEESEYVLKTCLSVKHAETALPSRYKSTKECHSLPMRALDVENSDSDSDFELIPHKYMKELRK